MVLLLVLLRQAMVSPSHSSLGSFSAVAYSCRPLLLASAMALALLYLFNPSFQYWRLPHSSSSRLCFPCFSTCSRCTDPFDDSIISGGCDRRNKEAEKSSSSSSKESMDAVKKEMRIHESLALQTQGQMDAAVVEAKRMVSQYQKEAEKCSSGMETCEVAREKSEAALSAEKTISAMWEKRARQLGWLADVHHHHNNLNNNFHDDPPNTNFFRRFGFSSSHDY